ncbi:hypothetical protein [Rhizobium tubonense]|uniref:Nucleotide modification associated domain-containing protein n=1 Tax=Rhizobium tubonense TaxID=484088 RepID=A0A2W4CRL0_9HYPH|nr:hypothetical protein [Rhizobium tubonense]PZM08064.1 hypothetical protein CPY51_30435 [Rhizobium tubonense]
MAIHSYVVRYDSGFAPNPFYGFCSLATCKPDIRKHAKIGDWILGSGSGNVAVNRGGYMVFAMCVTEAMSFDQYDADLRFEGKKPFRLGSRKQSCGDNIYFRESAASPWGQRDSFHSDADGTLHREHVEIDTAVNRVLISGDFVYFGGSGPKIPEALRDADGRNLVCTGIGRSKFDDFELVQDFVAWIRSLDVTGYQGPPFEWLSLRKRTTQKFP